MHHLSSMGVAGSHIDYFLAVLCTVGVQDPVFLNPVNSYTVHCVESREIFEIQPQCEAKMFIK